jgi:hypothetical protein
MALVLRSTIAAPSGAVPDYGRRVTVSPEEVPRDSPAIRPLGRAPTRGRADWTHEAKDWRA